MKIDISKNIFKKGDRVMATQKSFKNGLFYKPTFGTVAHNTKTKDFVSVRLDGKKSFLYYSIIFWEKLK